MNEIRTGRRRGFQSAWRAWLALLVLFTTPAVAQTLTVGGVGSVTPLVKKLAEEFGRTAPGIEVSVIDPPIGSTGGMRALAAGKVDVALSGRPLKGDEAGVVIPWVRTPLVLASSDGRLDRLETSALVEIYEGRRRTWDDGRPIRLVLRGEFESETLMLRGLSPDMDVAVRRALERRDAPVADNDLAALDMLVKIKGSLGTTSYALAVSAGPKLRMLPLNGQAPSLEALASGRYRWHRPYYLVHRANPSESTRRFLAYLRSDKGLQAARQLGYLPLEP